MSADPNPYEQAARDRKVEALARYLVQTMRRLPSCPTDDLARDAAVRFCDRADSASWQVLAAAAEVNPPSEQTIGQLRRFLQVERDSYRNAPSADEVFAKLALPR